MVGFVYSTAFLNLIESCVAVRTCIFNLKYINYIVRKISEPCSNHKYNRNENDAVDNQDRKCFVGFRSINLDRQILESKAEKMATEFGKCRPKDSYF